MKKIFTLICCFSCCMLQGFAQIETVKTFQKTNDFHGATLLQNGKIIFSAEDANGNRQMWVTDGTAAGTNTLTSFCASNSYNNIYLPFSGTAPNGTYKDGTHLYGIVDARTTCTGSREWKVFKTDGNTISYSNQTNRSFTSTRAQTDWGKFYDSASIGNKIYFFSGSKGIWAYDKTTQNVTNVYAPASGDPVANNDVHYIGKDGNDLILFFFNPYQLVRFNTTTNTISSFYDLKQFYQAAYPSQSTHAPAFYFEIGPYSNYQAPVYTFKGNHYFFVHLNVANAGSAYGLWKTDGTAAGTVELKRFVKVPSGTSPSKGVFFTPLNNDLLFRFSDSTRSGLWKTDGTPAGTQLLRGFNKSPYHSADGVMSNIVNFNGKAVFLADSAHNGDFELWETDGTVAGTRKMFEFMPGTKGLVSNNKLFNYIHTFGGRLYFIGQMWGMEELITSDGTEAGTYSLGSIWRRTASPLIYNNGTIFLTSETNNGYELKKVNTQTAKPYVLRASTTVAAKGQTLTVRGFNLKQSTEAIIFDDKDYWPYLTVTQVNDTTVSFTVPANHTLSSFRVAIKTEHGTFVSQTEFNKTTSGIAEASPVATYTIRQNELQVLLSLTEPATEAEAKLYDLTGRLLVQRTLHGNQEASFHKQGFAKGIYLLQVGHAPAEKVFIW